MARTSAARQHTLDARWAKPMLATLTERDFSDPNWIFERKLDGVRAVCVREGGNRPQLYSRNQKPIGESYPELVDALEAQAASRFVADGEIVAFDGGQTSFARLQNRIHLTGRQRIAATGVTVYYYLFDLLVYDQHDARRLPLRQRKRLLRDAFEFADPLRLTPHRNTDGKAYYREACSRGWEGVIAKRADSPYRTGRTRDWLKFTCVAEQEFVVGGFTDPTGMRPGLGALLVGYYEGNALRYAGKVGTGYDEATLRELRSTLTTIERDTSPFIGRVTERRARWVDPRLVVQVGFSEWTADGRLRHPRYTGVRTDKGATEVAREGS